MLNFKNVLEEDERDRTLSGSWITVIDFDFLLVKGQSIVLNIFFLVIIVITGASMKQTKKVWSLNQLENIKV